MTSHKWSVWITNWSTHLQAARRSPSTIRLRRLQLMRIGADLGHPPDRVTTRELVDWMAARTSWSRGTLRSHRAALTGLYGYAATVGWIPVDPTLGLPSVAAERHLPRPAPEDVVRAGLTLTDRVGLMVDLAARHGLRRAEVAGVHTRHVVLAVDGSWMLLVRGKGDRARQVPLQPDTAVRLRALPDGWVFPGGVNGHLSPDWVGRLVSEALPGAWTAHTLRHRFGTRAYAGSQDLVAVQELLGHVSIATTRGYVAVDWDAMRSASTWAA